jgi:hypothetical protein
MIVLRLITCGWGLGIACSLCFHLNSLRLLGNEAQDLLDLCWLRVQAICSMINVLVGFFFMRSIQIDCVWACGWLIGLAGRGETVFGCVVGKY